MTLSRAASSNGSSSNLSGHSSDLLVVTPCCAPPPKSMPAPCFRAWKMIACLVNLVKAFVLTCLNLVRRGLCFWRKERKGGNFAPVYSGNRSQGQRGGHGVSDTESWDSWDDDGSHPTEIVIGGQRHPETVADHISAYRKSLQEARMLAEQTTDQQGEVEQDLFSELVPEVKKQRKVYVGPASPSGGPVGDFKSAGRLGVQDNVIGDPFCSMGDELTDWDRQGNIGWQAEDEDLSEVLREQRKSNKHRSNS